MTTPASPPASRYVTISVRQQTWRELVALLYPRETMDQLVRRLIAGYTLYLETTTPAKEDQ